MKNPWFKFFPTDWRADPALRMCSLSARGLWIEMLCIMHDAEGFLEINGIPVNERALASLSGCLIEDVNELLIELENAGVYSLDRKGRIYSRRITRDVKKARTARKNGKNGGNPTLSKQRKNSPSVKGFKELSDKGEDKTQKPEARSQSKKETNKLVSKKNNDPPDKTQSKRGKRLDTDWEPSLADEDFARKEGLTNADIRAEADKFRDYWIAKTGSAATKHDWPATWRNWIRNSKKSGGSFGSNTSGRRATSGQRSRSGSLSSVCADMLSEHQEPHGVSEEWGASDGHRRSDIRSEAERGRVIDG
ncbi:hypothetical protein [Kiloniella majae]|uniref:hypothetical protein n=1 Tax=Kiloniella majae TaxID=1938558 RepID=UPI000A277A74|nr:hypothetical protein [Kiloniella majae]